MRPHETMLRPPSYSDVQHHVAFHCTRPDGFFGERCKVGMAVLDGRAYEVADTGHFRAAVPRVSDAAELHWLVEHHPAFKHYKIAQ